VKIYVSTCDNYDHLLPGFAWLFNKYWGKDQKVTILGFRPPPTLPDNFTFHSFAPVETKTWAEYLHMYFKSQKRVRQFIFLFDDYWLTEPINKSRVISMLRQVQKGAAKGDLSENVHHFAHKKEGNLVIAAQTAQYRCSTQPAFWNRKHMLRLLREHGSPWQFELQSAQVNDGQRLVGTDTQIYVYANVYYKGKPHTHMLKKIKKEDFEVLERQGFLKGMPGISLETIYST